jgi:GR25 family glycosyltransferase involved in LPS biosynthesis
MSNILDDVIFYCVCLVNRPERIESLNKIKKVIPNIVVIEAVDGKYFTKDDIIKMTQDGFLVPNEQGRYLDSYVRGRPLSVGNIGAFVSHRKALEAISKQDKKYGIIIEDDVVILEDFLENVENILNQSKNLDLDWLNLYVFESQRSAVPSQQCLFKIPTGLWGMQLYVVPKEKAQNVLNGLWPMKGAVDEQITRVGLKGYVLCGLNLIEGEVIKSYTNTTKKINDLLVQ